MKAINVLFVSFFLLTKLPAQTILEVGAQKNFIQSGLPFQSVNSYAANASFMLQNNGFPLYGGLTLQHFYAKDQLLKTNTFQQTLFGLKAGFRPLAKHVMIPVQPFAEAYYNVSVRMQDPDAPSETKPGFKNIMGFGGGLELYFSKRNAVAFYYGIEQYKFVAGEQLFNSIARLSFRFHSK